MFTLAALLVRIRFGRVDRRADLQCDGSGSLGTGISGGGAAAPEEIGGGWVKIVVVKSPKALRGLLRTVFGVKD